MKTLDYFIAHVLDRDLECTAEDIADMIWPARRLPATTKGTLKSTPVTDQKPPETLGLSLPEPSETKVQQSEPQQAPSPVPKPPSAPVVSRPDGPPA